MKLSTEDNYNSALKEFDSLIHCAFELSAKLTKLSGDARKQLASIMFAKINLCALSLRKLLPDSPEVLAVEGNPRTVERSKFCDVSSVASLCRNLIEASNRLYYVGIEPLTIEQARMRLAISEYHAVCGHVFILKHLSFSAKRLQELENERIQLEATIKQFSEFQLLSSGIKRDIIAGKRGEHLSQREIAERRGRSVAAFKADYKYLSSHIHSDSLSLIDLAMGKAGGTMTDEIRERLIAMTKEATNYLALTIKDMNQLFPQFQMSSEGLDKIDGFIRRLK